MQELRAMPYPQPDENILSEWKAITETLLENLPVDVALLRRVDSGSMEVLAAAPGDAPYQVGDRSPRDGSNLCDRLLSEGDALYITDTSEEPWRDATEHRDGFAAYLGTALCWPDGEAYGTLAVLCRQRLSGDDEDRAQRLLQALGTGATAQLALLVKREEGHYEATHDALTGLPNRQLFDDLAGVQAKVALRNGGGLWVVMWSIDRFREEAEARGRKDVNVMVQRVAERARSCIRQSDVLARLADNQFAFMLAGANEFVANAVADRLRRNLATLKPWPKKGKAVTASCGLTAYVPQETLDDWLARARAAMKEARAAGGDSAMVIEGDS